MVHRPPTVDILDAGAVDAAIVRAATTAGWTVLLKDVDEDTCRSTFEHLKRL